MKNQENKNHRVEKLTPQGVLIFGNAKGIDPQAHGYR